jgi:hypothetical protein
MLGQATFDYDRMLFTGLLINESIKIWRTQLRPVLPLTA